MAPVVGREIRAPDLDALGRQIVLDRVGAEQAGDAEERRERGPSPSAAVTDAMPSSISCLARLDRHFVHAQRMVLAVGADGVAGSRELADAFRIGLGLRPMVKKVALTHCAARIASTWLLLCGSGPSSKVSTTS